ncbi:hypothetical protein THARTR1_02062 [Trichoderma harzianum]|uniref:Mid2 domain-containing protein n=1 Tax=Trichoderma harzianum TaxID=5544 RepID=A0A2K0UJF5_TRIHA|nr:hypothetical protein THARTR1_02062 [Trichoderma harzianum]
MALRLLLLLSWLCVLLPFAASSELVVRRRLANRVKRAGTNVIFDNSTSFSLGLDGVTIFKYPFLDDSPATVTIVCTKCYVKGQASAKLTAHGAFNVSSAIGQAKDSFENTFNNLTHWAKDFAEDALDNFTITDIKGTFNRIGEIGPPPIDLNLDLKLPEYNVAVNLTDLEIYMEIDTILAASMTYTFNIYQSKTIVGVALDDELLLGAVFSIDLIFSVDSEIDIRSGFHVRFDNIITQIALFSEEASKIDFDGGKIAFLPVTIQYGQVILKAILRVEARIGIAFEAFIDTLHVATEVLGPLKVGAGVEARIYANVAEFITNITLNEVDSLIKRDDGDGDDDNCQLTIAQGFTFGIGAAAGASVELLGNTWGPSPETEIPLFYTTLAAACITSKSSPPTIVTTTAASTRTSAPKKRADGPSVTSTVTTETQSATVCNSAGLINCPASLQSVQRTVVTKTLTSTITPGVSVAWTTGPASTFQTVDFQDDAVTMTSSSGKPKSYTPPPPPPPPTNTSSPTGSATDEPSTEEKSGKHRVSNAVIIGVSVGLGVPALLAAIGAFIYFFRRHRKASSTLVKAETSVVGTKAQPVVATYAPVRPEDDS